MASNEVRQKNEPNEQTVFIARSQPVATNKTLLRLNGNPRRDISGDFLRSPVVNVDGSLKFRHFGGAVSDNIADRYADPKL